mgnify:CR=1 FL=1
MIEGSRQDATHYEGNVRRPQNERGGRGRQRAHGTLTRRSHSTISSSPRHRSQTAPNTSPTSSASSRIPAAKHVAMGTHNALVRLSDRRPSAEVTRHRSGGTKPPRAAMVRSLDNIALQAELTERPRLIHWVAAHERGIDRPVGRKACSIPLGNCAPDGAGQLSLADQRSRDDGTLPAKRASVPTLIRMGRRAASGADTLPNSQCVTPASLAAAHPGLPRFAAARPRIARPGWGHCLVNLRPRRVSPHLPRAHAARHRRLSALNRGVVQRYFGR